MRAHPELLAKARAQLANHKLATPAEQPQPPLERAHTTGGQLILRPNRVHIQGRRAHGSELILFTALASGLVFIDTLFEAGNKIVSLVAQVHAE